MYKAFQERLNFWAATSFGGCVRCLHSARSSCFVKAMFLESCCKSSKNSVALKKMFKPIWKKNVQIAFISAY